MPTWNPDVINWIFNASAEFPETLRKIRRNQRSCEHMTRCANRCDDTATEAQGRQHDATTPREATRLATIASVNRNLAKQYRRHAAKYRLEVSTLTREG